LWFRGPKKAKPSTTASGNPTTATRTEREGKQSRHNQGYDEVADLAAPEVARRGRIDELALAFCFCCSPSNYARAPL
jgi:hypothetical protein